MEPLSVNQPISSVLFLKCAYVLGHGVQGKVLGPSLYSSPHFSEWLAMRPLVLCDDDVMTFTASGEGFTHLFVDRGKTFETKGGLDVVCKCRRGLCLSECRRVLFLTQQYESEVWK